MQGVSLLVVSCDAYQDLWDPFTRLLAMRWPDCPFPVYLGSNHARCDAPNVTSITIGEDRSWTEGVGRMLDQIGGTHVLMLLEDFLLTHPVDTRRVLELTRVAQERDVGCLRIGLTLPPSEAVPGLPGVGRIGPGRPYRASTQAAIWRVDTLRRLLVEGFTAWDFEIKGTRLTTEMEDEFWCAWPRVLRYHHGVERGRWLPEGLAICRRAGIVPDLERRPAMTRPEVVRRRLAILKSRVVRSLPGRLSLRAWPPGMFDAH